MKTKIFINWEDRDVLTETAYKARVAEIKNDADNFDGYKTDFLSDEIEDYIKYTLHKVPNAENIFNLTDKDRKNILDNLRKNYEKAIENDLESEWEEFEIET